MSEVERLYTLGVREKHVYIPALSITIFLWPWAKHYLWASHLKTRQDYQWCRKRLSFWRWMLWSDLGLPQASNSYVKFLTPSVTVFGDVGLYRSVKGEWGHEDGALIQGALGEPVPCLPLEDTVRTVSAVQEESPPCQTLLWGLQPPGLWESKFPRFNPPRLWCFALASRVDQDSGVTVILCFLR